MAASYSIIYICTRAPTPSISRALFRGLHGYPSAAQGHLSSIQPNLGLPHTHPPLTSSINTIIAIWRSSILFRTISLLSDPLYSPASFIVHSYMHLFVSNFFFPTELFKTSSQEQSLPFSQHFSSPCLCLVEHRWNNYYCLIRTLFRIYLKFSITQHTSMLPHGVPPSVSHETFNPPPLPLVTTGI